VVANDNRSPAGQLRNGVLTVHLEVGTGVWHPESEDGEAIPVYAFGESGRALQNPGPAIRVPQGTQIQGTVHNALPVAVTLHGLHERPGDENDAITLAPGSTKEFRFSAGAPGSYFYWGTTTGKRLRDAAPLESQLAGAFVVDPPGAPANDRIFVIGLWLEAPDADDSREFTAINGKSWPFTEHFTFKVGETVHWRWLNPSESDHAMHLHGFYYHLDAVGDAERSQPFAAPERPLIVTQHVRLGGTFDMTWVPERSGRWLFHCHMLAHMSPPDPPPGTPPAPSHDYAHEGVPESAGMGGLVLGITVEPDKAVAKPAAWHADRKLQLVIDERASERPRYELKLVDPAPPQAPAPKPDQPSLLGPPIVLTRGEPVEIEVVNHMKQPTSIHWHGIELESYYDGVAGWTGAPGQISPPILPGKSFVARMTPPRTGTFIYHTHWHELGQLENGIYGPLIVVPSANAFDSLSDQTFLFSMGEFEPFEELLLVNGHPQPAPLRLETGKKYRLRFINIAPNNVALRVSLRKAGVPVQWRIIAKDGADLPPALVKTTTAEAGITVGETFDVEFTADSPQELSLEVYLPGPKLRTTQGLIFAAAPPSRN
jgi:FtsP/CotA-like multicopper oxidase with cupredoxin domain